MSDEAIPEGVMKAATKVWRQEWRRSEPERIALAILAERERCAKLAETMVQLIDEDGQTMRGLRYRHASEIASSIRSSS